MVQIIPGYTIFTQILLRFIPLLVTCHCNVHGTEVRLVVLESGVLLHPNRACFLDKLLSSLVFRYSTFLCRSGNTYLSFLLPNSILLVFNFPVVDFMYVELVTWGIQDSDLDLLVVDLLQV